MRLIIPDIHEKIHLVEKLFELADRPGVEEGKQHHQCLPS